MVLVQLTLVHSFHRMTSPNFCEIIEDIFIFCSEHVTNDCIYIWTCLGLQIYTFCLNCIIENINIRLFIFGSEPLFEKNTLFYHNTFRNPMIYLHTSIPSDFRNSPPFLVIHFIIYHICALLRTTFLITCDIYIRT